MTATWQTKVFVAATETSSPARVKRTPSASRVACDPMMFVMASTRAPALAGDPHRRQGVGRLARLGDADDEVARPDDRVAVAVLRRDVHLDGHAGPLLDRVATDEARVVARAAGHDDDAPDVEQQRLVEGRLVGEVHALLADGAVGDRLGHRVGLLVDLLEHEALEAALLGGLLVPVDLLHRAVEQPCRRAPGRSRRPGVIATSSPFSMTCTRRVWRRKAGMAEARNVPSSSRPTTSGHSRRAPTRSSGSSRDMATKAKCPSSSA